MNLFRIAAFIQLFLSVTITGTEIPASPFLNLAVISGSAINSSVLPPLSDGGSSIHSYKLEWDTDPGVQEIQAITTSVFTGPNEIQSITTYAQDIPEVQRVQTYATAHISEKQEITISEATGGYFFLELDTSSQGGSLQYSGYIYVNYAAYGSRESLQQIISEMSNVQAYGSVKVNSTIIDANTYAYLITFPESMGDVPLLKVNQLRDHLMICFKPLTN